MTRTSAQNESQNELTVNGFLYSKLGAIGSKSEDPRYYLQVPNITDNRDYFNQTHQAPKETEVEIEKNAKLYYEDPVLQKHLETKVLVVGKMNGKVFSYTSVQKCDTIWCKHEHQQR